MSEFRYLQRPNYVTQRSKDTGRWREASLYHNISEDGETSVCGVVRNGQNGFGIVNRKTKVLRSMTCSNCRQGRVTSK